MPPRLGRRALFLIMPRLWWCIALFTSEPALRHYLRCPPWSYPSQQYKHEQNDKHDPETARRVIAPTGAVRPSWKRTDKD